MSDRPQLRSVVADTSALVSLAVPRTIAEYDAESNPDPLAFLAPRPSFSLRSQYVPDVVDREHDSQNVLQSMIL